MKWNMPFVESRTFDTRLTKSALISDYGTNATNKSQRPDYRQFKSNYPKESCFKFILIHFACPHFPSSSFFCYFVSRSILFLIKCNFIALSLIHSSAIILHFFFFMKKISSSFFSMNTFHKHNHSLRDKYSKNIFIDE